MAGLKPGLLEKWKATKDPVEKCMPYHMRLMNTMPSTVACRSHFTVILRFNFLKAFIVHKDMTLMLNRSTWRQPAALGFSSVPCMCAPQRTFKVRKDTVTNKENWVSLPLCELRKLYATEVEKKFLDEQVVAKQRGIPHPQACPFVSLNPKPSNL